MSKRFRLILCVAFALMALLGCVAYGEAVRSQVEAERNEALERYGGEVTTIVVAAQPLEVGEIVNDFNCEERDWVSSLVPDGAVTALDDVYGHAVSSPVSKGTPLTQVALRDSSETLEIPAGMAAYSLSIDERSGVSPEVPLGTTLVAYRIDDESTTLVSSEVSVIGRASDEGGILTLAVPYEDVTELIQAATQKSLRLVQPSEQVLPETSEDKSDPKAQENLGESEEKEAPESPSGSDLSPSATLPSTRDESETQTDALDAEGVSSGDSLASSLEQSKEEGSS